MTKKVLHSAILFFCLGFYAFGQLPTKPYKPTSYQTASKYLNPGGSFYLYMDSEQWGKKLGGLLGQFSQLLLTTMPENEQKQMLTSVFHLLGQFNNDCGLRQLHGFGFSTIAESEELFHNRFVLAHEADALPEGLYWEMFTGENIPLTEKINSIPADAVLASWAPCRLNRGWEWIRQTVQSTNNPVLQSGLDQWVNQLRAKGLDLDQWLASLGSEMGLVVTVDPDNKVDMPQPNGTTLAIPQAAVAIILEVKEDTIFQACDAILQAMPAATRVDNAEMRLRSMAVPVPVPIKVKPTLARVGSYLIIASNDEIVNRMNECRKGNAPSIRSNPEFQTMSKGFPEKGMGFSFLSKRFSETISAISMSSVASNPQAAPMLGLMQSMQQNRNSYGISLNMPGAVVGISRTNFNVSEMVAVQGAIVPTAVVASMLLPALSQARGKARAISDMGNLKQIGLGMMMYANDFDDKLPQNLGELWPYLNNGKVFVSPAGKTPPPQNAQQVQAGQCDYLYFVAGKSLNDMQKPSATPAACTKPGLLKRGVNVLYCDGHVQQKPFIDPALQALIEGAK